jgi:hypothetical protein
MKENNDSKSGVTPFTNAKQSLLLKPKTTTIQAFIYHGIEDLENLIGFVGVAPKVNIDKGQMVLSFGRTNIQNNSVIMRNAYGEVTKVLTLDEANAQYDIAASSEFLPEHKNKLVVKPKVSRKPKTT